MNAITKLGTGCFLLLAASAMPAAALPVIPNNTTFEVGGSISAVGSTTFMDTTGIDFGMMNPDGTFTYGTPGGNVQLAGTGAAFYRNLGFIAGTAGTAVDLPAGTFNGIGPDGTTAKVVSFPSFYSFTVGAMTLSFDLDEIADVIRSFRNVGSGTQTVTIDGLGVVHLTGYQDADSTFSFTATRTGTGITTSFSSSVTADDTVVIPTPEPASLAILGLGLFGVGLSRRKKSS